MVAVGDAITGSFSYDNTTVGSPFGSTASIYSTNHISSFLVNSLSGSRDVQNIIIFDNSGGLDGVQSRGLSGAYSGDLLAGNSVTQVFIQFEETTGSLFSSTALPSTLNAANFDSKFGHLSLLGLSNINFNVTSFTTSVAPVPVPAAVWLMGSALAGLVGFKRKKAV